MNKKTIFKNSIIFILIFSALFNFTLLKIYEDIVLNSNIIILLATLIAGLFGFIIAVIPFSIQLLNQDNKQGNEKNSFLNKLMDNDKFNFYVKPMLNRFIKALRIMFYLFIYIFFIHIVQIINIKEITFLQVEYFNNTLSTYLLLCIFYVYIILIINFFIVLKNIIRDLESLVFDFIKSKTNNL